MLLLFAGTLLLSAALLLVVQPMIGKMLLPRLGGTPAVWNTCIVFFQVCLLAGYAYAHYVPRWLGERRHAIVHVLVLCAAFVSLPLGVRSGWALSTEANPVRWVLMTLALSVGLPFFAVSTNAPLLQRWYAATGTIAARDAYSLYAASNAGSLVGLLAYPLVLEPQLRDVQQARVWAIGYALLVLLTIGCAAMFWRRRLGDAAPAPDESGASPTTAQRLRWIVLALVPSSYLLGVTTFTTSDVAAAPLLWIVPLALYLLSFVLVFARRPPLPHRLMATLFPAMALAVVLALLLRISSPAWLVLGLHLLTFFAAAMVCHGELARLRPPARHLTDFYLMLAIGGALGGAFNALIAPLIFNRALEYPLAIALAVFLCPSRREIHRPTDAIAPAPRNFLLDIVLPLTAGLCACLAVILNREVTSREHAMLVLGLMAIAVGLCIYFALYPRRAALAASALLAVYAFVPVDRSHILERHRSFFGIHRIARSGNGMFNELYHGRIRHGMQRIDLSGQPTAPHLALAYFHHTGPIGQVLSSISPQRDDDIAIVGLGVGALAAYARPDTRMTFYEIDPAVRWVACESRYFSFISTAQSRGAKVDVVLGDARVKLAAAPAGKYDIIVLDAFSGDAIPIHLLTRQALAVYLDKLKPHGIIAIHISNIYLDLEPVIANLAADARCAALGRDDEDERPERAADGVFPSQWVVIAPSADAIAWLKDVPGWRELQPDASIGVWSDEFSNVVRVFRWWRPRSTRDVE